jgi:hypothetical protein
VDNGFLQRVIGSAISNRRFIPSPVRAVIEDEAQIVDVSVVFAVLEASRIRLRKSPPIGFAGLLEKYPHHPRKKAVAPGGPYRSRVTPLASLGV